MQVSNSSYCIEISEAVKLYFDEPNMDISYWEAAFNSFSQMKVFKPTTNLTVVISVKEYKEGQKLFDKSLIIPRSQNSLILKQGALVELEESIFKNQFSTDAEKSVLRFIENGEIVYGNGLFYKSKNFFQKKCVRIVVTDYPRIMLLDSVNHKVLKQYEYKYDCPPKFTQVTLS